MSNQNPKKTAYLDCSSGMSGDMLLGALLDAGVSFPAFKGEMQKLGPAGFKLSRRTVNRGGLRAVKLGVKDLEPGAHRHPGDFLRIIDQSRLSEPVKKRATAAVELLARTEARIHGVSPDKVHFHELSGIDTLVDIVGALTLLEMLGVDRLVAGPVSVGGGTVKIAHGTVPVPAPAAAALLRGFQIRSGPVMAELVTPTGALLLQIAAEPAQGLPEMALESVGYGAGDKDFDAAPNVLRVLIGVEPAPRRGAGGDWVAVVETDIDNMTPEQIGALFDEALGRGVLDFNVTPIIMKKNRPAWRLTALVAEGGEDEFAAFLLRHTKTLGVRISRARRVCLDREFSEVRFRGRKIGIKTAVGPDGPMRSAPEFDDCLAAARELGLPVAEVMDAAQALALAGKKGRKKGGAGS